jgi:uncharacterized protein (TIGR02996 family)
MRTFEFHRPDSHKFWTINVHGDSFTVTFGKVGTAGQTQTKSFANSEKAQTAADKLIREKTGKGYVETTPPVATREAVALERALAEDPYDRAGWCVYADYLAEHGSPRGEFMQVQLALEDEARPKAERKQLQAREAELLAKHEREWLGNLVPHLIDRVPNDPASADWDPARSATPGTEHRWRRGILAELQVSCLTVRLAQALADAPVARFLEKLHIVSTAAYLGVEEDSTPRRVSIPQVPGEPYIYRDYNEWFELLGVPLLRSLRVFQMGDCDGEPPEDGWMDIHTYAPGIERLIAEMPRIEELHLLCKDYNSTALFALPSLARLRVLRMYALGDPNRRHGRPEEFEIELDVLARNPALGNLTHLLLHPHFADDRSFIPLRRVAPVFHSRHLKSLTHLQLRLSDMGDEGVQEIVASGILKRLKWLDLRHGRITDEGARLFAACADARNLDRLDLSRNAVTSAGLNALRTAGVNAVANNPLTAQELADQQYLHEGDFE